MWTAYVKNGEIYREAEIGWKKIDHSQIVKLQSIFCGRKVTLTIPPNARPIVFNTGYFDVNISEGGKGEVTQTSQTIGYVIENNEYIVTITPDGITRDVRPVRH